MVLGNNMKKKKNNPVTARKWRENNPEKVKLYRDRNRFNININEILERYDFKCQSCGMTQEQHIIIFGSRLIIHHIDGKGRTSEDTNNDMNNLIPLCRNCHARIHRDIEREERWGDLLKQDDSEYRFPEIRKLVNNKSKKLGSIQKAKKELSEELDVSFWTIDTKYYERKLNKTALETTK